MNIQKWKVFDSRGHQLNWIADSYINLQFSSPAGKNAAGFIITDPSGVAVDAEITSGGYLYDTTTTASYLYTFDNANTYIALNSTECSINYVDVSIFNPDPTNSKAISSLNLDISTKNFVYPSFTYAGALFLNPVSQGLVETEQLFILEVSANKYIRPYDNVNSSLIFQMVGDEDEIKLFTINEDTVEVIWTDQIIINDLNLYVENSPLTVNIGFRAEEEGVFERKLRIYHVIGENIDTLTEIVINAQSIGEDERFRTLLGNFGLPDPKDFPEIFKETDINEDLIDWSVINPKSKHMILEHDKIMPYVGTYKALINALKWLGYDDIYIREWFRDVKENKKLSLLVPYNAKDRAQTILKFSPEERKTLKKLNQLSLIYCLTQETGEVDDWGTPITENCYEYNLNEIFIKLLGLKQWLERNIIGVNCRIIDLTGEGIYFERFRNLIYTTDKIGYEYKVQQNLSPYALDHSSELITGDASIRLTFAELCKTKFSDLPFRFADFVQQAWNPYDPCTYYNTLDASYIADPSNYLLVGPTFQYPFINLSDIQWKLSVEKDVAGVIGETLVTNPLFIYNNEIRYYNIFDSSSVFFDASTNLSILLENAYLRDPSIDEWVNSIAYSIYPDPCDGYIMESSSGDLTSFNGYVVFEPDVNSRLQYAVDANYRVPLLSMQYYKYTDTSNHSHNFGNKIYYLDILDGKIAMNAGRVTNTSDNLMMYINWNYDTSLTEQMITVNAVYQSPRIKLTQIDPSIYYWSDPSGFAGTTDSSVLIFDNSVYSMKVNHIGDYNIELFGWDSFNTPFYNPAKETYKVWVKTPTIYTLVDSSIVHGSTTMSLNDVSILINLNKYPIYDQNIPLQGLTLEFDSSANPYISIPSITYFQDVPQSDSYNRLFNLNERILTVSGNIITIDPDFQHFYTGDNIRIVKFNKGKYSLIAEASSNITLSLSNTLTLDNYPTTVSPDSSSDIYILNDTYRTTKNPTNLTTTSTIDISGYIFDVNQLVSLIVTDISTNYSWGASYRIESVDGSTHTLNGIMPTQFISDTSKYLIETKHAFSTYSEMTLTTDNATEVNNVFKIYLKDTNCQEYYLDNNFVLINVLFDHDKVNAQWYDASDNLINNQFYYYNIPITIDVSTLVLLNSKFDNSTYMLNQKNIWTVKNNLDKSILFKVYNNNVPYIFDVSGYYDIQVESYDKYGNLSIKSFEGILQIV